MNACDVARMRDMSNLLRDCAVQIGITVFRLSDESDFIERW
jgi:hypothetical protein